MRQVERAPEPSAGGSGASSAGGSDRNAPSAGGSGASSAGATSESGGTGETSGAGEGDANGASGAAAASPSDCALPADYVCTGTHVAPGCGCNPALVTGHKDCDETQQLSCDCLMGEDTVMECVPEELDWNYDSVVCHCDASAPLEPGDCAATEDFQCQAYAPYREGCACLANSPKSAADCQDGYRFGCEGYDPDYGCSCSSTMR